MKVSRYNVVVGDGSGEDMCVVHNTLTRATTRLPRRLYATLERRSCLPGRPEVALLYQQGFLVDDTSDEYLAFRLWDGRDRYQRTSLGLLIAVTTACNLRCVYCFGAHLFHGERSAHMTVETADRLLNWVEGYVRSSHVRRISACFSGGEPLLYLEGVERLCRGLREVCHVHDLGSHLGIGTNAYLLTPATVERLCEMGITNVATNLDGTPAVHDARRPHAGGGGTFDTIVGNLAYAGTRLQVNVGVRLDRHNCDSVKEMALALADGGLQQVFHTVQISHVDWTKPASAHCQVHEMPQAEFAERSMDISETLLKLGFRVPVQVPGRICSGCTFTDNNYYVDYRGDLYKCQAAPGHAEYRVGNVTNSLTELTLQTSQLVAALPYEENPRCRECPYLPLCKGGCPHEVYTRSGGGRGGYCLRDYFAVWLPEMVRMTYVT